MRVKIAMCKREQFFFGLLKPARCQFLQGTVVFLYAHKNHIVIFRQQREVKKLELFLDIRCRQLIVQQDFHKRLLLDGRQPPTEFFHISGLRLFGGQFPPALSTASISCSLSTGLSR